MAEDTAPKQPFGRPFLPGQSGNPAGRPKGARSKLGEAFIADLYETWQALGMDAILSVIQSKPAEYLKVVASLLPKQVEIKERAFDEFSDAELAAFITAARSALVSAPASGEGTKEPEGPKPPSGLSSLH